MIYPGRQEERRRLHRLEELPQWRRALNRGGFRYAVIATTASTPARVRTPPPQARWIAADPAVTPRPPPGLDRDLPHLRAGSTRPAARRSGAIDLLRLPERNS